MLKLHPFRSLHYLHRLRAALPLALVCSAVLPVSAYAQPEAVVEIANASREATTSMVTLPGTVISTRDAQIRAEVAARIDWIAPVGTQVEKGEPLAHLDDHLLSLQLRGDEARIARLKADIAVRERQRQRLAQLESENNMAEVELDRVEGDIEMLEQDLAIAIVEGERTRYDIERSQVPAPFSGIVVSRNMAEGEFTAVGSALVRLVDTQSLEISVPAPLRVARFNRPGAMVEIRSASGDSSEPVRSVVPVGDEQSRMMELRIAANRDNWLIGEAVTVLLPQGDPVVTVTVPRDALVLRDQQQFVYTIDKDNRARKVMVETTGGMGSRISVKVVGGELNDGAPVIVRGAESLRDGQDVRIATETLALEPEAASTSPMAAAGPA